MECINSKQAVAYVEGAMSEADLAALKTHLDECRSCSAVIEGISSRADPGPPVPSMSSLGDEGTEDTVRRNRPQAGVVLGDRFRLVRVLGEGAMGVVYEAYDETLRLKTAVKVLQQRVSTHSDLSRRLRAETVSGRRINHPNVCRVFDVGNDGDWSYITMELLEGETLAERLYRGLLPEAQASSVLEQIAAALQAAHESGVIHRDLKPANIMLVGAGDVKVMDFGLAADLNATTSQRSGPVGTPAYWSPEQGRGELSTEASDVYTFGVIAYQLFCGKLPGLGRVKFGGVPRRWRPIVRRCLQRDPARRLANGGELRRALRQAFGRNKPLRRFISATALVAVAAAFAWAGTFVVRSTDRSAEPAPQPVVQSLVLNVAEPSIESAAEPQAPSGPLEPSEPKPERPHRAASMAQPRRAEPPAPVAPVAPAETLAVPAQPSPPAAPQPDPAQPALVNAARLRLETLEQERARRALLAGDLPDYEQRLASARADLEAGRAGQAQAMLEQLDREVASARIDEKFVAAKLKRLTTLSRSKRQTEGEAKTVNDTFLKVHAAFFSGKYDEANAHLNAIHRVIAALPTR